MVAGRTAPGSGSASSPSRSVHRIRANSSRPAAPRSTRAAKPGAGRGESRTARQAPQRGGRSAVIAHPDSVRSASRRSAGPWALMSQTKPPAPRRFRGRAPAARKLCWSHCPFPGLIGTITPALRGGTSRAAPHVRGTDRRVARHPTSGAGLGAWLRCPVVNGAGADRYWPVGSGGHGPFVRALTRLERAADRYRAARCVSVRTCG